jgi:hypothetical protein
MALDRFAGAIAAELRGLAAETENLAAILCSDPELAAHCLGLLQKFDYLAQSQAELADLLLRLGGGADGDDAVRGVRLSALADRLKQAA